MITKTALGAAALASLFFMAGSVMAADLTGTDPPVQGNTLWHFLGIPQGARKIHDATTNRHGNHPDKERKPPLKRIGDPSFLSPELAPGVKTPAVMKVAAQVKIQEDMKDQKIKAIKYLSTLGCYKCYPGIDDALLDALKDCTEEVRFAAAEAFLNAVSNNCAVCQQRCCCTKKVLDVIRERANKVDDNGCFIETSEQVRDVLNQVLCTCCQNAQPSGTEPEQHPETIPPSRGPSETIPRQSTPESSPPPPAPTNPMTQSHRRGAVEVGLLVDQEASSQKPGLLLVAQRGGADVDRGAPSVLAPSSQGDQDSALPRKISGHVANIAVRSGVVELTFDGGEQPAAGSRVEVYHKYLLGEERLGSLVVLQASDAGVIAKASPDLRIVRVGQQDRVTCLLEDPGWTAVPH